jgi:hypothetical protein
VSFTQASLPLSGASTDSLMLEIQQRGWRVVVGHVHAWIGKPKMWEAHVTNSEKAFSRLWVTVSGDGDTPFEAVRDAYDKAVDIDRRKRLPEKDPESFWYGMKKA